MIIKGKRTKGVHLRKNFHLSDIQKQLCYGTLLGDASLNWRSNGQCRLKVGHCEKQQDYLEWKRNLLMPFILQSEPTIDLLSESNFSKNGSKFYIYNTIAHQDFTDMAGLFYRKVSGKRIRYITMKTLKLLNPFAILIWYLDDGILTKDKEMRIYSNAYSLSHHKAIKIWFWQQYRIETKIVPTRHGEKIYYFLRFSVNNSKNLQELFNPYIDSLPECIKYKLLASTTIRKTPIW